LQVFEDGFLGQARLELEREKRDPCNKDETAQLECDQDELENKLRDKYL
jgi:hypothetical protein